MIAHSLQFVARAYAAFSIERTGRTFARAIQPSSGTRSRRVARHLSPSSTFREFCTWSDFEEFVVHTLSEGLSIETGFSSGHDRLVDLLLRAERIIAEFGAVKVEARDLSSGNLLFGAKLSFRDARRMACFLCRCADQNVGLITASLPGAIQ